MIGEAFLFALGTSGALLFLAAALHVPITAVTAAVAVIVAVIVATIATLRGKPSAATSDDRSRLATILALIPLLAVIYTAAIVPLNDFDGRAFWLLKAKGIAHDGSIHGPFFHEGEVLDPRNNYPLLMPMNGAAILLLGRTYDDTLLRWLFVAIFAAILSLIHRRLGAWPAAVLAWVPQFCAAQEGGAVSAYNDIVLAAFVAAAFFELAFQVVEGERPWRFGCWLAFLALTKNEGLPLAFVLLVAGAFVFRRRLLPALVPLAIALVTLVTWRRNIPKGGDEDLAVLLPTLPQKLDRLPGALAGVGQHLVAPPWGLFWFAVAVAFVVLSLQRRRRELALSAAVIGGGLAFYIAAYTVTTWIQPDLINSSADRLLMHLAGPALFALSASARSR
jgi:hypothetical protein